MPISAFLALSITNNSEHPASHKSQVSRDAHPSTWEPNSRAKKLRTNTFIVWVGAPPPECMGIWNQPRSGLLLLSFGTLGLHSLLCELGTNRTQDAASAPEKKYPMVIETEQPQFLSLTTTESGLLPPLRLSDPVILSMVCTNPHGWTLRAPPSLDSIFRRKREPLTSV